MLDEVGITLQEVNKKYPSQYRLLDMMSHSIMIQHTNQKCYQRLKCV